MKKNIVLIIATCAGAIFLVCTAAIAIAIIKNPVPGKLSTLEFVVEIAKAIAWPAAFVFFVTLFQDSIGAIVKSIRKLALPGGASAEFGIIEQSIINQTSVASASLEAEKAAEQISSAPEESQPSKTDNNATALTPSTTSTPPPAPDPMSLLKTPETHRMIGRVLAQRGSVPLPPSETLKYLKNLWMRGDSVEIADAKWILAKTNEQLRQLNRWTAILWDAAIPEVTRPNTLKGRWTALRRNGVLSHEEKNSLDTLWVTSREIKSVVDRTGSISSKALGGFLQLSERLCEQLQNRTKEMLIQRAEPNQGDI